MNTRAFAGKPGWFRVIEPGGPGGEVLPGPPESGAPVEDWLQYIAALMFAQVQFGQNILTELHEMVQRGVVYAETVQVASLVPVERLLQVGGTAPYNGLFSVSLTNDGAGTVQYRIPNNVAGVWVDLFPNEVVIFNAVKGVFISVAFRVQGAAARVRLVGVY